MSDIGTVEGRQRVRHMDGCLNVSQDERYANITRAIRRGLPQLRAHPPNDTHVCLVGSGPSLASTLDEIKDLVAHGAVVIALNNAYEWLLRHDVSPRGHVIIDARPFNARFITRIVPHCTYFLASQCAPEVFDAAKGGNIILWHCLTGEDKVEKEILDGYYLNSWQTVGGGCTVGTRAIVMLRHLGFQSFHVFGMDSCLMDGEGHILPQPENDGDPTQEIVCADRTFRCTPWHCEQALELLDLIASNGEHFQLEIHGDGLLAHIIKVGGADDGTLEQLKEGA